MKEKEHDQINILEIGQLNTHVEEYLNSKLNKTRFNFETLTTARDNNSDDYYDLANDLNAHLYELTQDCLNSIINTEFLYIIIDQGISLSKYTPKLLKPTNFRNDYHIESSYYIDEGNSTLRITVDSDCRVSFRYNVLSYDQENGEYLVARADIQSDPRRLYSLKLVKLLDDSYIDLDSVSNKIIEIDNTIKSLKEKIKDLDNNKTTLNYLHSFMKENNISFDELSVIKSRMIADYIKNKNSESNDSEEDEALDLTTFNDIINLTIN